MVGERLLQRRQLVALAEALDGLDRRPVGLDGEHHAALHERAVHDHRARAAVAGVAADMAPGEAQIVAQKMDQQAPRVDVALVPDTVDLDGHGHPLNDRGRAGFGAQRPLSAAWRTARAATTPARCRRYSDEAWTSEGGSRAAASTAARTSSAFSEAGSSATGTASTHPRTTRRPPSTEAAAFTMQVPSLPMVMAAKPSRRPGGIAMRVSNSPGPTAVM